MTLLTLDQRQDNLTREARKQLLEILEPAGIILIYSFTRHTTRSKRNSIVEFFVIRNNQPIYISRRIAAVFERYAIPPSPWTGMILQDHESPKSLIRELGKSLYGYATILEVREL